MKIFHNSQDTNFRAPFGALHTQTNVKFTIEIAPDSDAPIKDFTTEVLDNALANNEIVSAESLCKSTNVEDVNSVILRLWLDGQEILMPMESNAPLHYSISLDMPENPMLVWYYFLIELKNGEILYYGNNSLNLGGEGQVYINQPPSFQITVYSKEYDVPKWISSSVMYQIFVDRFYNGNKNREIPHKRDDYFIHPYWNDPVSSNNAHNDFYGGNLAGVTEKLDYLADLGISVIYLNPIFDAYSNHKYDIGNYMKIDQMFGDEKNFKQLCKEAKKRGISIILDGVFNHTGDDSIYFNKYGNYGSLGAYQSDKSQFYNWYKFEEYPEKYASWWGVKSLPAVNQEDESFRNYIINDDDSVIKHWLRAGARGWRLDVVDELPSWFVKDIRTACKDVKPDSVVIGEVWEDASNKVSYGLPREYLLGQELDGVMNYPFKNALNEFITHKIDALEFSMRINSLLENYPWQALYSCLNLIDGHDVIRAKTLYGEAPLDLPPEHQRDYRLSPDKCDLASKRLKIASLIQMTFFGVPLLYYGDEVGLEGYPDPYNRAPFPWNNADTELHDWYKRLIEIRNNFPTLQTGSFKIVYAKGDVLAYIRTISHGRDALGKVAKNGAALVIVNTSKSNDWKGSFDLKPWGKDEIIDIITNKSESIKKTSNKFTLKPLEAKVFAIF
ncbi:MAG: glycoside hydrolase family 13 protein [Clostridiales bacterium]|jgi:4-alpha-glucanotransferase|nr:glycoside hydrolase family 13 protein [Clostridiales bacterium]